MIEDKQKALFGFQLLADAICIVIAYFLAYYLRFYIPIFPVRQTKFLALSEYSRPLIYLVPMYLLIYTLLYLYISGKKKEKSMELIRLLLTNVLGVICFITLLYVLKELNISRIFILTFFAVNVLLGIIVRFLISAFVYKKKDEEMH